MQLSPVQQEAVEYVNGPCIVGAGAGSGKTRVIIKKFEHLVRQYGIHPNDILCITFTNKAAEELKNRLYNVLGIENPFWVRTIHSACLQMIKPFIVELGYKDNFTITSMSKQKSIVKQILYDFKLKDVNVGNMVTMISRCKDYPNPIQHLESNYANVHFSKQIFNAYQETMHSNNFLDFDDILHHVYWLFHNNYNFHNRWTNTFKYILVDEYQDINNIQYLIIKQFGQNITVVGDDYQAIYAFRGSDPKYFINFDKNYTNAKMFKLEQNYRSSNSIVKLSQSIIDKNEDQIHKKCFSELQYKVKPKVVHFKDEYEEIAAIVKTCKKYIEDGFNLNDIAILYRIKMSSRVIEQEFNRHKIPHKIVNDISFFERKEIKDLMAYMLFLYNFNDSISLKRVLQNPKRGIGEKTIETIFNSPGETLIDKVNNSILMNHGRAFISIKKILNLFYKAHDMEFKKVLQFFVDETEFMDYLEKNSDEYEFEDRKMNVNELISMTQRYETMIEFLEDCALINPDDHLDETPQITLMTIHAAKGLEFKVVFVIGLEEETLPHYRSIQEASIMKDRDPIAEERRLFYVACTRAANVLNISRCIKRGWKDNLKPSRFIKEIDSNLYIDLCTMTSLN